MITCYLKGGLGNQLFQIFTTIAYALNNKCPFFFTRESVYRSRADRPLYWSSLLFARLQNKLVPPQYLLQLRSSQKRLVKEKQFQYSPLPYLPFLMAPVPSNTFPSVAVLDGYFQSPKYFENQLPTIVHEILGMDEVRLNIRETYPSYANDCIISMHFRWGDYKYLPNKHPVLPLNYYERAMETIVAKLRQATNHEEKEEEAEEAQEAGDKLPWKVLYFCEFDDHEEIYRQRIVPLMRKFSFVDFECIDHGISDWEQLLIMSNCRHHIMANSTFSWWGAYLSSEGETEEKIVVAPLQYFGRELASTNNLRDFFPQHWLRV